MRLNFTTVKSSGHKDSFYFFIKGILVLSILECVSYLCNSCKSLPHSLHKALFFPLWTHYLLRNVWLKILPSSKHLLTQFKDHLSIMEGCFWAFLNYPPLFTFVLIQWSLATMAKTELLYPKNVGAYVAMDFT